MVQIMHETAKRLLEIGIERGAANFAEIAKAIGASDQSATNWKSRGVSKEAMLDAAKYYGVNAEWLRSGKGHKWIAANNTHPVSPHEDDYALVRQFHANGSCGDGYMNDHVEIRGGLAFKRDWLARMRIDPVQASVIYARGDSMAPTLNDGEVLLIDGRPGDPQSGKVYVIEVDGDLRVKRLFKRPNGWVLVSDSPDKARYPDEQLASLGDIRLLGRVAWRGGGM